MRKTRESCPRCDHQGWLFPAIVKATGEKVIVCDECEALWKSGDEIPSSNFIDMSTYLESLGLEGVWADLEVEWDDSDSEG